MRFRYLAISSLLGLAALLLCLTQGASATYYPGDIVISTTDQRNNETIDIAGSIMVMPGGYADWQDVTVIFNSTSPAAHGLYIDADARFARVNITALANTTLWWFKVNSTGSLVAERCDFGMMNGSATDPGPTGTAAGTTLSSLVGGVQIYSSNVFIGNSSIHDGRGANVYVNGSAPRINNNHIFDARYVMFEYATSFAGGRQTSDFRGVAACVVQASGALDLDRNRIEQCGAWASADATDLGAFNATLATSNLRLVGVGVAVLSGAPTLRLSELSNVTTVTPSSRTFTLGNVSVTHNLFKIASWGYLFKETPGATVAGGYIASADTGIEILDDAAYAGGALNFDIFAFTVNGTYVTGINAAFASLSQGVTMSVDSCTFGTGGNAAVNVWMSALTAAHSVSVTLASIDLNTQGTGIAIFDTGSSGKPTITASSNTIGHTRAPISIGLQGLTGGAALTASSNFIDNSAGAVNGSLSQSNRGGIDLRWVSLAGGTINVVVDSNRVYNQTWSVGPFPGITLHSFGGSNLVASLSARNNVLSNVSDGLYVYEDYSGSGQNAQYNFSGNRVENALSRYGIFIQSLSTGGALDPAFDRNLIDRAQSYAVYFYVSSAVVAQRTFGNNTVYGNGPSRCCGMYFLYGVNTKWPLIIADSLVFNTSFGLIFQQIIANVYRTDVSQNNNGTQCQDCIAHFYESQIYPLSATVSGAQSEVVAYQMFGSPRVQWQADGGKLVTNANLQLDWIGPASQLRLATIAIDTAGMVANRSLQAWKKTVTQGDVYQNLTPSIHWGSADISGLSVPFQSPFYGNVTIVDPELPIIKVTTPGPGSQVRARIVHVHGSISDQVTGVEGIQYSVDGTTFTNITLNTDNTWDADVTFPTDGVFDVVLHGWDVARWAITFGDTSAGFAEYRIQGIVIDTQAPRLEITDPPTDITTRNTTVGLWGIVSDTNAIDIFQFSYHGALVPVAVTGGNFNVTLVDLTEGPNLISVLATDRAGNTNVTTRTIVVDTVPPHINIYAPLNNSFTNRAAIEISADVEQDVIVLVNGVKASFPYAFPLRTVPPLNKIWINATDRGQNQRNVEIWVTYDHTAPDIRFTAPARFPFYTRDPHVIITATATEPLMELVVNGVTYPLGADPTAVSFELYLEDGSHTVLVHITDLANNSFERNASPIVVDTQAPSLRVDSPADRSVTPSRTLTFRGRTDANAFLNITTPSGRSPWDVNPVTGEFSYPDTRISDGVFPFIFEATDAVGNSRTLTVTVTVDTTRPNIEVLAPPPTYATEDEVVNFHGTVGQGSILELTVDSPDPSLDLSAAAVAVTCAGPVGADCLYNFDLKMAEGQTTIKLVATDLAGNFQVKEVFVRHSVEGGGTEAAAPPQNAPLLAILGVLIGLATFPLWVGRFRAKARADDPSFMAEERAAKTRRAAPAQAPAPVAEEEPHDMYADDAMSRRGGGY